MYHYPMLCLDWEAQRGGHYSVPRCEPSTERRTLGLVVVTIAPLILIASTRRIPIGELVRRLTRRPVWPVWVTVALMPYEEGRPLRDRTLTAAPGSIWSA